MKYRLTAKNLSVNGFDIRDFSAEFSRILLVKGSIGSGKTLLLKALAGVYGTKGELSLTANGTAASTDGYFVHSQPEFNFVTANVADEAAFAGIYVKRPDKFPNKSVKKLSGGELKKISVMFSLYSFYNLLLLDEPLEMLDDDESKSVSEYICEVSKEKAVIIATHSSRFDTVADSAVCLNNSPFSPFIPQTLPPIGKELLTVCSPTFTLSLRAGEIGVIYGKNASGKTRTIRRLAGLKSWGEEFSYGIKSDRVGVCLQFPENMIWQETISELITDIAGREAVSPLLEKLGWRKRQEENPMFLSDGEKRILFLHANLFAKELLIFDEPFAGLDQASAEQIKAAFYEAALIGKAILYTANNAEDIFLSQPPVEGMCRIISL
jgi:energy-coupling factor transporter ATP-binding protein EcfA2